MEALDTQVPQDSLRLANESLSKVLRVKWLYSITVAMFKHAREVYTKKTHSPRHDTTILWKTPKFRHISKAITPTYYT
jgi:hypothetical protein